jgi:hypothetical protein
MPLDTNFERFNNHNLHDYDPYVTDNEEGLLIDETWWCDSLTTKTRDQISALSKFKLTQLVIPHKICPSSAILSAIYYCYLESFDYQHWYNESIPNGPRGVHLILLSESTKSLLCEEKIDCPSLLKELENICDGKEFFVRLSGTSGKNEQSVSPFRSPLEIIRHLSRVRLFKTREFERRKETFLVLVPWNDDIEPRYEFRIFVVNNSLTAASPQNYFNLYQYSSLELDAFEKALNNITFIGHIPYNTFVADVYIHVETATCHLIELNPFGAHCGAGASFFNWIDDYKLLHGKLSPPYAELRYLSSISY